MSFLVFALFLLISFTFQLSTTWVIFTLRGLLLDKPWAQVAPVLPPPVCAFTFVKHRAQHSHCSSIFIEYSKLTLSRFPPINQVLSKKSPYEYALSET